MSQAGSQLSQLLPKLTCALLVREESPVPKNLEIPCMPEAQNPTSIEELLLAVTDQRIAGL